MALLAGKVALVTGAGSGIGRAVALAYAREGAKVVVSDITEMRKETAQAVISAGGEACEVRADVCSASDCQALVEEAVRRYGRLDIACNNAGIAGPLVPLADYPEDAWQKVLSVNLTGVFHCLRSELAAMLRSGGGAIVNMSSVLGQVGFPAAPGYVAAKHGVIGLTQSAAQAYAPANIRVNAVLPGFVETPMLANAGLPAEMLPAVVGMHPMNRLGRAEEVAELVVWLSSEKASFATGGCYPVDGGFLAR